jgi:uncharacterized repeat protein (TIGR01451 family)
MLREPSGRHTNTNEEVPHMHVGVAQVRGIFLAAGLLVASLSASALPAAAAIDDLGPDLSVSMVTTPSGSVQSGGPLTYALTITNTASTWKECIESPYPGKPPRCITQTAGRPVSNVAVRDTLPAGAVYQSAVTDSGFACSAAGGVVNCVGGSLPMSGSAHITLSALAPTLQPGAGNQILQNTATVNPNQTIDERSYANNTASSSVTDNAPIARPDLVVTGLSGPTGASAGGQATYTINVANQGTATATGVSILLDGGTSGFSIASSSGSAGFAPCYSSPERFSLRAWCPGFGYGTLAAGASATISVVVQLPSYGGNYTMSATVDPYNSIVEANESNNVRSQALSVS